MKPKAQSLEEAAERIRANIKKNNRQVPGRCLMSQDHVDGYVRGMRACLRMITGNDETEKW
jgi:hypothetical protein